MGFDTDLFPQIVDAELICTICKGVFEVPVFTKCGHTFCQTCIESWVSTNASCPVDRKVLFLEDLMDVPFSLKNMVDQLEMICPSIGCDKFGSLKVIRGHLKKCSLNPDSEVVCEEGCDLMIKRGDLDSHSCLEALKEVATEYQQLRQLLVLAKAFRPSYLFGSELAKRRSLEKLWHEIPMKPLPAEEVDDGYLEYLSDDDDDE